MFVLKMTAMTSLKVTLLDCYDLGTLLTSAVVTMVRVRSCSVLSAPHVQLLKYIRMLRKDEKYAGRIHTGYLVNFRQHVTHDAPDVMTVEFDIYDAATDTWSFNYTPDVA